MTESTERLSAALAGRYRIERRLGEGGMATVYLAEDLKHDRKVAVKVLRPELAAVLGADRFVQEIKTTANLQHPHILPLFDSGEADSFLYYVMPFIDGETLRDKLDRETQLGIDEAVKITTEIADALDYAHRHDVIHRDIKPENILLHDGRPMVADFGIALAVSAAGGGRMTETGLSLGTPHYMSPEQATAEKDLTNRSDVYSLGSMLFEMLTGEPPYMGNSAQQIIMKIVTEDAQPVTKLRKSVPPNVTAAVAKSLEKLPADRFESAASFSEALANPGFTRPVTHVAASAQPGTVGLWNRLSIALAGSTGLFALALAWMLLRPDPETAAELPFRSEISSFQLAANVGSNARIAISSDGSKIALASRLDGIDRLYIRDAGRVEFTVIPGTDGGNNPTFSPDGEWLLFQTGASLKRVELATGLVLPVTEGSYGHWGLEDTIVFISENVMYQMSPLGGERTQISDFVGVARPHLLPDGAAVVFQDSGAVDARHLMVLDIGSGEVTDLGIPGNNPQYVPTGHLVYGHESQAIMAVPFDLARREVTGSPRLVAPDVVVFRGGATQFDVSQTGTAVFGLADIGAGDRELVLVDRDGSETALPLRGAFSHPRFAPLDGRRIAYENRRRIWIHDLVSGANVPLSSGDRSNAAGPWWSQDGQYVYYGGWTNRSNSFDGLRRVADASRDEESLYVRTLFDRPIAQSLDGSQILIEVLTTDRGRDLVLVTRNDDGTTSFSDYLRADWNEYTGAISPDGAWLAYVSDESGIAEVYTRSFPAAESQQRVSLGGGSQPVWAPDGSAIYYRNGHQVIRAVVSTSGFPTVASRVMLFETDWLPDAIGRHDWDIHPDGQSFVAVKAGSVATEIDGVPIMPVQIVVNWFEELKAKVGN